jgi:hypothetical protein
MKALWQIITRKKSGFVVTSKKAVSGNHGHLVTPHLIYIALVAFGILVGIIREGLSASILSNIAWSMVYVAVFIPFIMAAFQKVGGEDTISLDAVKQDSAQ